MQFVVASNNPGKIKEFNSLLKALSIEAISQAEFSVPPVAETGKTFVDNAMLKAQKARQYTELPVLADDSGLSVETLQGQPGVFSARYAGDDASDQDNIEKLLKALEGVPWEKRQAWFHCALVLLGYSKEPIICEASWSGFILEVPQGEQGFGYDPVFYVPGFNCSAAELAKSKKNQISHRGQALQQLVQQLKE